MAYSHVLVLHTDNGSFNKTKYVIDIAQALKDSGFKVYLMTSTRTIKFIQDVPIKLICSWVPRTIFGYFRQELTSVRSILLALYACWYPPRGKRTYVICDGSTVAVPLLKYYGYRVTYISYIVSFYKLLTKASDVKMSSLQISCLKNVDDIIIPSSQCNKYLHGLKNVPKTVIMPCCTRNLHAYVPYADVPILDINKIPFLFTVLGEYNHPQNFYNVLYAFANLRQMLSEDLFRDTRLVFIGSCESEEEQEEMTRLQKAIKLEDKVVSDKIYLYNNFDIKGIKTLLKYSLALIDTTEDTVFNIILLRAQEMGVPTICFGTGFHEEILQHEVTGVFINKHAIAIRNSMHRFIRCNQWAKQLGKAARKDMKSRFSSSTFRRNINNLVMSSSVIKFSTYLPSGDSEIWSTTSSSFCSQFNYVTCET